jgi:hypothetical protein
MTPNFSVIITTYDVPELLVLKQDKNIKNYEIIFSNK